MSSSSHPQTGRVGRYAAETEVPVERSKRTIELLLQQHGAEQYHTGWDQARDIIEFGWQGKQIRFVLPRPKKDAYSLSDRGFTRSASQQQRALEQADRQRWRALYLVVRAKLEAVEAGIAVFEEEFMAFIVVPGRNQTIGEILVPQIKEGRKFDVSRMLEAGDQG
jgi:hypothetical protein